MKCLGKWLASHSCWWWIKRGVNKRKGATNGVHTKRIGLRCTEKKKIVFIQRDDQNENRAGGGIHKGQNYTFLRELTSFNSSSSSSSPSHTL